MTATIDRADASGALARETAKRTRAQGHVAVGVACVGALIASQVIGAAYSQNQNTYLVRAIARSTHPALNTDRLVRSADPTPAFTWLSRLLITLGDGPTLLYVGWVLAAATFFGALMWATADVRRSTASTLTLAAVLAVVGSPSIDLLEGTALSKPLEGLASQYALGPVWQPSCAGVLLVLGTVAGARRGLRPGAVALLLAGALLHPTYLLPAAVLVVSLVVAHRGPTVAQTLRSSAPGIAVAAVGAAIVAIANRSSFAGITDPLAEEGNRILAFQRIAHHADFATWFGRREIVMITLVLLAAVAARRRPDPGLRALGTVLAVALGLSAALTGIAVVSGSPSLLLGFPWRTSVVLVPLAIALLLAFGVESFVELTRRTDARLLRPLAALAIALLVLAGAAGTRDSLASITHPPSEGPVVAALHDGDAHGTGLVPTGRVPYAAMGQTTDDIRINAGLPVYVDWKNNPNEPTEVVAWWQRLDTADDAMASPGALCQLIDQQGLTWAVVPADIADAASDTCLRTWSMRDVGDAAVVIAP